jgi:hypothetical protein
MIGSSPDRETLHTKRLLYVTGTVTSGTLKGVLYSEPDMKLAASQAGLCYTKFSRHFLEVTFVEAS